MLNMSFSLFKISEYHHNYQLIIQILDCPVENGRDLLNNEILLLKAKELSDDLKKQENEYEK